MRAKRGFELLGLEAKRARVAPVCDPSLPIDQIEPIGPARIRGVGGIVEAIDERRQRIVEQAACLEEPRFRRDVDLHHREVSEAGIREFAVTAAPEVEPLRGAT